MAITEKVLGPNSSQFSWSATDTTSQIMAAMDAYITSKGWEVFDSLAPQGLAGTGAMGRVYRTLQQGSTSVYKYVGLAMQNSSFQFKIYEAWNATTHVGTNDGAFVNINSSDGNIRASAALNPGVGTDASIILMVNPRWLAVRFQYNNNSLSHMHGAFEIMKEYGEADSTCSNIFMSSQLVLDHSGDKVGSYGSCKAVHNPALVGLAATYVASISTQFGKTCYTGRRASSFANFLPNTVTNGCATMVAMEVAQHTYIKPAAYRGRIMGIKLVYGNQVWNDGVMIPVEVDQNFNMTNGAGTVNTHHFVKVDQQNNVRFLIPA